MEKDSWAFDAILVKNLFFGQYIFGKDYYKTWDKTQKIKIKK